MTHTLYDLQAMFGGNLPSDVANITIDGIAPIETAQQGELTFISNVRYLSALAHTTASVVLIPPALAQNLTAPTPILWQHSNAYATFTKVAQLFHPDMHSVHAAGVHATASIDAQASIANHVHIGAYTRVLAAHIGEGSIIGSHCSIADDVKIGKHCKIYPGVHIYKGCILGDHVVVHSGTVIGSDGFGFAPEFTAQVQAWHKIPQMGHVEIGDDVEIGANCTIDRATFHATRIGKGCKLDNQIQIAHNVEIGDYCVIAGCTSIAGSTKMGHFCVIGGASQIAGHLTIADKTTVSGGTSIMHDIVQAGSHYTGVYPSLPHQDWKRQAAYVRSLGRKKKR